VRHANSRGFESWAAALERGEPCGTLERETRASRADEIVMLALRLGSGLAAEDHAAPAWRDVVDRYGARLERAVAERRLERTPRGWHIAPRYRFVADEVIAWLMAGARPLDDSRTVDTPRTLSVTSSPCLISPSPVG
jgi:coproporphyrinogen III oxidase-like Fe-S oxidoreductase